MNIINELNSSKVVIRKIHESEIDALLMNYDYNEQGLLEFMYEDFINAVFNYIPEYALGEQALPKKTNDIVSKVRESAKSILKLKHIEKLIIYFDNDIPFNDWDEEVRAYYNSKGVLGELVFHFILREFVGTIPLISKIYFKDTFEQEAHGFDVVHIKDEELWLGESKFYESGKQGVDELIKDLTKHFNKNYLSEQFIIINRNLSASTNKSIADAWIKKLSGAVCIKDVCSYINIPLFCLYSEKSLSELNIKSTNTICRDISQLFMILPILVRKTELSCGRGYRVCSPKKRLFNANICLQYSIKIDKRRTMKENKGKKIYRYTYYTATGKEIIEVDEKWYGILRQADRDELNNNRREEYKSCHLEPYMDEVSGEEHDAWEMVADKETLEIEREIFEKMDEGWVLDCLSKRNKYIYEKCINEEVSQSAVAKELNLTQSSVSRRLKKILYAMEWQRLKDGRNKRAIKEELDFRQIERANDTELGESVIVDYFLGYVLEPQDLMNFIGWFYSVKELKRYTFKAWRKLEKIDVEKYVESFLLRCSIELRSYIINTYGKLPLGFQFMFMELFKEMYRRMQLFPTPKGNAYIKANAELKKIVKRLKKKTTENEFLEMRIIPVLEKEEKARIKNFQKIYGKRA